MKKNLKIVTILLAVSSCAGCINVYASNGDCVTNLGGAALLGNDNYPYADENIPYGTENFPNERKGDNKLTAYLYQYGSDKLIIGKDVLNSALSGNDIADYQWYRNSEQSNEGGTPIDGAVLSEYVPTENDFGYYLYFTAKGKGNFNGTVTSNVTAFPVCIADSGRVTASSNDSFPIKGIEIKGTPIVGASIEVDYSDGVFRKITDKKFRWYRNDKPENSGGELISGAEGFRYDVTADDLGKYLYVELDNGVSLGTGQEIVSPITEQVTSDTAEITGVNISGKESAIRNTAIEAKPQPQNSKASVQWYRNDIQSSEGGIPIAGANKSVYVPVSDDVGKYLYCVYTPIYPFAGNSAASEPTEAVRNKAIILFNPNGGYYGGSCREVLNGEKIGILDKAIREGYNFKGWSLEPDITTEIFNKESIVNEDMTVYAAWEKTEPEYYYEISDLKLLSENGEPISEISENLSFMAEVTLSEVKERSSKDYIFVAVYGEGGKLLNLNYVKADFNVNSECSFGFNIHSQSEKIEEIKAFVWSSFGEGEPLAESKSIVLNTIER